MAAPANITIADISGKWLMNKTLSDSPDPALQLQGIGWFIRKAIGAASVTLHVKQYQAPPSPPATGTAPVTHIDIDQTATAGLKGTSEQRCLDLEWREHSDWMFGTVRGQSTFMSPDEIEDEFLKKGWLEGEAEATGPDGKSHVYSHVESLDNGWTATQIWGFQTIDGERRYARNVLVKKGDKRVEIRLVYDWLG
ncbi:hypothetical protein C8034_v007180 [Colletotrichum sidae]|uniref:Lccl domain-containing protein n=3 Tax=Colletotrichum orbiculare species complex TaxID=2707354 RepID=N4W5B4_COLOR|nr:hypothetical protein Cob_v001123 [Colletotrichum orbiculare MAFF 240422]TDZ31995.1 hypothetical protein CTRI78_v011804 [Colletotrichum trifolii]TEA21246.1 hypothetical protein C8034_v007180 [Colletotrichum sidae]